MDMLAYINCMKSHSTKNPVAEAINSVLDQLNNISLTGISQALQDTFSQAKQFLLDQIDSVGEMMKKIKDGLPLLKASDSIFNKLKISQGIQPAADGGDGIKGLTANIKDIANKALAFAQGLTSKIGDVVSGVVTDVAGFIGDLASSVGTHIADIGTNISAGLTTISNTMSDLKDYAIAKFTSGTHLPSMSELMSNILPTECPAPSQAIVELDNKVASNVVKKKYEEKVAPRTPTTPKALSEQIKATPATNTTDVPAPVVNGKSVTELKQEFAGQMDQAKQKTLDAIKECDRLDDLCMDYRDKKYPDYWDRKQKSLEGNSDDINIFQNMKRDFCKSEEYLAYTKQKGVKDEAAREYARLMDLWEKWQLQGFTNVPNGPW